MRKRIIIMVSIFLGLGTIQNAEAQLLGKLKKKAEKKVENTIDGKPNKKKASTQKTPTVTPTSTPAAKPNNKPNSSPKTNSQSVNSQPSWIDTTRVRNAFWKEEIAQQILAVTGNEPYKSSSTWNLAKNFTEGYNDVKTKISTGERPDVSADMLDFIDALLDSQEFDKRLESFNNKMGGQFSSTQFWKETKSQLLEWRETVKSWKNAPAIHFDMEGVNFETSVDYLKSVRIDTISNENFFDVSLELAASGERKTIRFTTIMDTKKKAYIENNIAILSMEEGYFAMNIGNSYRIIFGPNKEKSKEIEDLLPPLIPEKNNEDCIVCKDMQNGVGKILMTTQGEPIKSKGMNFFVDDPAWNGLDPIFVRFVFPESPVNILSKTNPWFKKEFKLRWYVKGHKENAQMSWRPNDLAKGDNSTFWYRMYDGFEKQELPPLNFNSFHYAMMRKGPGKYTIVADFYLLDGDDKNGWKEKIIATGQKEVNLTESAYQKLFVGTKKGIGAYKAPAYTGAASNSIKAAVKKMYPSVKTVYMSNNNEWVWVRHPVTGVRMYEKNRGVIAICDLNNKDFKGAFYIPLTAKRDSGVYSIMDEGEYIETSRRNFNIK